MALSERIKFTALGNCIFFGERYIKPYTEGWNARTSQFHYEMIDALEDYEFLQVHVPYDHERQHG